MSRSSRVLDPVRRLIPNLGTISHAERVRASVGAMVGLLVTGLVSRLAIGHASDLPLLIAPMGASAVLLFAVPASPLAQPWSILGGNTIAALAGVTCGRFIAEPMMAAAIAGACAIGGMLILRCLHPPSGAVALTAVLGGPAVHAAGYGFVAWPVGLNSLLLLGVALLFNNVTGRRYPHLAPAREPEQLAPRMRAVSGQDIEAVLRRRDELVDVDRRDLLQLVREAEGEARAQASPLRCVDLMVPAGTPVSPQTSIEAALAGLAAEPRRVLMVTQPDDRLVGYVSQDTILRHLRPTRVGRATAKLFERSMRFDIGPRVVADIMEPPGAIVGPEQPVDDVAAQMIGARLAFVPVVEASGRLLGLIDQSSVLATLYRRVSAS